MEEMETMMYKSCVFDLDGTLTDTPVSYTHQMCIRDRLQELLLSESAEAVTTR